MNTVARPISVESSHFYTHDGQPLYQIEKKDGSGFRPFTLADARKMNPRPLPSVTTILKTLHKEALVQWRCEQSCLAVLTAPRGKSEDLDTFVQRVLHDERQQDQEAKDAADLGTRIHRALEDELGGRHAEHEMLPWIEPVWDYLNKLRCVNTCTETILVGDGYAGRTDLIQVFEDYQTVWDFKSCKTMPKNEAYWEARLQRAAYAQATGAGSMTTTGNIYISTTDPGKFKVFRDESPADWEHLYQAFEHLVRYWQIANDYTPTI